MIGYSKTIIWASMVHEHELLWTRLVFGAHMVKWNQVASQRSAYTGGGCCTVQNTTGVSSRWETVQLLTMDTTCKGKTDYGLVVVIR